MRNDLWEETKETKGATIMLEYLVESIRVNIGNTDYMRVIEK